MSIYSNLSSKEGIFIAPYKAQGLSYDIEIHCHDFTDSSNCNVNTSIVLGSCANVTFDDNPAIGGPDEELDIGVQLCIEEGAEYYNITFSRWDYNSSNEVATKYCINSPYITNECSDWVLNSTDAFYDYNHTKTMFGGIYKTTFLNTSMGLQWQFIRN